jgi:hypothetical protein
MNRTADVTRNTKETQIRVRVDLDGTGQAQLSTGIGFFDHMLDQIARHGLIDLLIDAKGDLHIDGHHTVEDVGITLGMAVAQAVADKRGILLAGLVQLKGVRAFTSEANMVLVRWPARDEHDDGAATRVFEQLKAAGILVKNVSKMHPLLRNCLRLTVGTPSENQQLLSALQHCL